MEMLNASSMKSEYDFPAKDLAWAKRLDSSHQVMYYILLIYCLIYTQHSKGGMCATARDEMYNI